MRVEQIAASRNAPNLYLGAPASFRKIEFSAISQPLGKRGGIFA